MRLNIFLFFILISIITWIICIIYRKESHQKSINKLSKEADDEV
jgi:hypothetical protein